MKLSDLIRQYEIIGRFTHYALALLSVADKGVTKDFEYDSANRVDEVALRDDMHKHERAEDAMPDRVYALNLLLINDKPLINGVLVFVALSTSTCMCTTHCKEEIVGYRTEFELSKIAVVNGWMWRVTWMLDTAE